MKVRCRRASVNRRSGAVNRHERDVRMTCSSRSTAVARCEVSSSRACAAETALACCRSMSRVAATSTRNPSACRCASSRFSSCARQRFGRHVRVCLELEQTQIFWASAPCASCRLWLVSARCRSSLPMCASFSATASLKRTSAASSSPMCRWVASISRVERSRSSLRQPRMPVTSLAHEPLRLGRITGS